ncbi:TetR/AcrR family transcriptional regulator [Ideonella livida]|uniref:TetR/AcrR family transcriptional regulator n=1 Tax=Ideonella livida TaxID=2707176 RepID=A0A7C9TKH5_9BURK|nr:TetR/AcrR family transcriptional regulator [Ideonella livida]NDY91862.1 TetR/AcrR family transcriptional regulator [Ideonella livida]
MPRTRAPQTPDGPADNLTAPATELARQTHPATADAPRPYHHGQLRTAALEAARQVVRHQGHGAVAMRELAQGLGVAPSALYRHFAHRTALLLNLADAVHAELLAQLQALVQAEADPQRALRHAAHQFLAFAQAEPGLLRMVYDDGLMNAPDAQAALPALQATHALLLELTLRAWPQLGPAGARLRLIAYWSTLFGYAMVRSQHLLQPYMHAGLADADMAAAVVAAAMGETAVD